jgi:hypothetical protein
MATPTKRGKGLIRSMNRSQTSTGKARAAERSGTRLREPTVCERCGAVFARRVWRRDFPPTRAIDSIQWTVCPACELVSQQRGFGRVLVEGEMTRTQEELVRHRITKIEALGAATQPQRRVVSIERDGDVLEVLTTSQKLAHRIARALGKMLGGKPQYLWSDDRTLVATLKPRRRTAYNAREAS